MTAMLLTASILVGCGPAPKVAKTDFAPALPGADEAGTIAAALLPGSGNTLTFPVRDALLNSIYFEKDATLVLYYYKGKTTYKYRLSLANGKLTR